MLLCIIIFWMIHLWPHRIKRNAGIRIAVRIHNQPYRPPKPEWVRRKVIRLKALMPQAGCRTIAHTFNRLHEHKGMTVSKSYVNTVIRNHQYDIQMLRRKIKHKRPKPVPLNRIWGMDLTGKFDTSGKLHHLLGVVEHQSRSCMSLKPLVDKSAITLLECLIVAIKKYGKPKIIHTDNEAIFTSKFFRLGLWILGIKHQQTEVASPWKNGKVERFFGTLKQKLNQWEVASFDELNHSLHLFRFWYNHVRPHDYDVHGCTSAVDAGCMERPLMEQRLWKFGMAHQATLLKQNILKLGIACSMDITCHHDKYLTPHVLCSQPFTLSAGLPCAEYKIVG